MEKETATLGTVSTTETTTSEAKPLKPASTTAPLTETVQTSKDEYIVSSWKKTTNDDGGNWIDGLQDFGNAVGGIFNNVNNGIEGFGDSLESASGGVDSFTDAATLNTSHGLDNKTLLTLVGIVIGAIGLYFTLKKKK